MDRPIYFALEMSPQLKCIMSQGTIYQSTTIITTTYHSNDLAIRHTFLSEK